MAIIKPVILRGKTYKYTPLSFLNAPTTMWNWALLGGGTGDSDVFFEWKKN